MKRVTRNSVIAVVAASGAMAVAGSAYADSTANGSTAGSPGVISGNTIQLPVHVPVNVCGNTVNVVGLLNPAAGNSCANVGGAGGTSGGATATGAATDSPGVISGNNIQLPVHSPVNVSGNTVNAPGALNPVFGNTSVNGGSSVTTPPVKTPPVQTPPVKTPPVVTPPVKTPPVVTPPVQTPPVKTVPPVKKPPVGQPQPGHVITVHPGTTPLAHTGADGMLPVAGASVALLLGGIVLRRRFQATAAR